MGNHKFRLSKMIPNAWFNKLKNMTRKTPNRSGNGNAKATPLEAFAMRKKTSAQQRVPETPSFAHQQRYFSYRFSTTEPNRTDHKLFCNSPVNPKGSDTHFPLDLPRKSSTNSSKLLKRRSIHRPSPCRLAVSSSAFSPRCSYRATLNSFSFSDSSPESEFLGEEQYHLRKLEKLSSLSGSCNCRDSYSTTDIILEKFDDFNTTPPPMFNLATTTKKVTKTRTSSSQQPEKSRISIKKEHTTSNPVIARAPSFKSTKGVKLRKHTKKLARKSVSSSTTKGSKFGESFAVVKNSNDPLRDFKDSMMEMIVENNIRASKDLEELLACYLLLNSNEYHDLIVKAFEHIWFEDRI